MLPVIAEELFDKIALDYDEAVTSNPPQSKSVSLSLSMSLQDRVFRIKAKCTQKPKSHLTEFFCI